MIAASLPGSLLSAPLFANLTLIISVSVVVVISLVVGLIWLNFVTIRKRLTQRFEEFKDRVMDLRQQVEKIKERHQLLPAQKSELQGMTGRTLEVYQQVDASVKRLWDVWLERMGVWEDVQARLQAASVMQVGRLREAEQMLDRLSFEEVDRSCQACVHLLDRLEQGQQEQAQAQGLLHDLEECLQYLRQLRHECSQRATELGGLAHEVADYFSRHPASIRPGTAAQLAAAGASLRELQRAMEASRPDWPAVRQQLEESWQVYTAARQQAYESAVACASEARQALRRAREVAEQQARLEEQKLQMLRQQEAAAAAATQLPIGDKWPDKTEDAGSAGSVPWPDKTEGT